MGGCSLATDALCAEVRNCAAITKQWLKLHGAVAAMNGVVIKLVPHQQLLHWRGCVLAIFIAIARCVHCSLWEQQCLSCVAAASQSALPACSSPPSVR